VRRVSSLEADVRSVSSLREKSVLLSTQLPPENDSKHLRASTRILFSFLIFFVPLRAAT